LMREAMTRALHSTRLPNNTLNRSAQLQRCWVPAPRRDAWLAWALRRQF
jgi:hypothetical protein